MSVAVRIRPLRDLDAVRTYVAGANVEVVRDEPTWIGLRFERPKAWIKVVGHGGGITVLASVCKTKCLKVRDPSRLVGKPLVVPTLIERDGQYLVCERCPFGELTAPLLDEMLWFVARSAATMRQEILRATGVLEVVEPFITFDDC
jgi:hypothetical protein